jgi:hypothetical protein
MFKNLFHRCNHKWVSHAKKEYTTIEKEIVDETENWNEPVIQEVSYSETREILICTECGKIKKIIY